MIAVGALASPTLAAGEKSLAQAVLAAGPSETAAVRIFAPDKNASPLAAMADISAAG